MIEALKNSKDSAAPPLGELTTSIHINIAEMPDHVRNDLSSATLDFIRGILHQPGGREALDAKINAKKSVSHHAGSAFE